MRQCSESAAGARHREAERDRSPFSEGAKRSRLIRQLVTESLLLSMTGAATGLVLAYWTDRILLTTLPVGTSPLKISAEPDFWVFLFTAGWR